MKTIFMTKAQHEAWDSDLRDNGHLQGKGMLETPDGKYCCLGRLQVVLDGDVERCEGGHSLCAPSARWLESHGISFLNDGDPASAPFLESLGCSATLANDAGLCTFTTIADAIAECVEYTDE